MTPQHRRYAATVAAAVLLTACGATPEGPSATSSAATTAGNGWSVNAAAMHPAGRVAALIAAKGCALAVGSVSDGYGHVAASWRSADCRTFTSATSTAPAQDGDALPRESKIIMTGVTALPDGTFVAVGYEEERDDAFPQHAIAWSSADGMVWRVLADAFPPSKDDITHDTPQGVVRTARGTLLAYGSADSAAAVWRSVDGSRWTALPVAPRAGIDHIAQGRSGRLVAVGQRNHSDTYEGRDAAAWTSDDDGRTWRAATAADGSFTQPNEQIISDVAVLPDGGWIAVGFLRTAPDQGHVAAWLSSDGTTWHHQRDAIPSRGPFSASAGLILSSQRLVIGGRDGQANAGQGAIWTSTDGGRTWTSEAIHAPPVSAMTALDDGRIVVIAEDKVVSAPSYRAR